MIWTYKYIKLTHVLSDFDLEIDNIDYGDTHTMSIGLEVFNVNLFI